MKQANWVDDGNWKQNEAKPVDNETLKKLIEELKKANIQIDEFKKPNRRNPQPMIPTIWTLPPKPTIDKDWEKEQEEQALIRFMQECRERTMDMKDSEKCERCKLRFRCYTEIKVEKKNGRKKKNLKLQPMVFRGTTQVVTDELDAKKWEKKINGIFDSYTESNP